MGRCHAIIVIIVTFGVQGGLGEPLPVGHRVPASSVAKPWEPVT